MNKSNNNECIINVIIIINWKLALGGRVDRFTWTLNLNRICMGDDIIGNMY